ncbi:MAG: SDR family oxidoreductase [Hyphomonadaceae bacterium]|nr:SDR family oxidoreductase [Hyphomonadaceae bacterium]
MAKYAITGGASGIGAELCTQLKTDGHDVLSIDLHRADAIADLATPAGRIKAVRAIMDWAPDGLDGFVPCAGLPLHFRPLSTIVAVNFFGTTEMVLGLQDLIGRKRGTVLLVASNSARMIVSDDPMIKVCLNEDEPRALDHADAQDAHTAYAGSKRALVLWMRRNIEALARKGVRMNAIAPGVTLTPMTEAAYQDPEMGETYRSFASVSPWHGREVSAEEVANLMRFMMSRASESLCGSVVFIDGGADAKLHPDLV